MTPSWLANLGGSRPPRGLKDELGRERILGWAKSPGAWVAATDSALVVMPWPESDVEARSIPWEQISKATWTDGSMELLAVLEPGARASRLVLEVDESGRLPEAVQALVTRTVVMSRRVERSDGVGARIAARRGPDALVWAVTFDAGLDSSDPNLQAWADREIAALKDSLGL